MRLTTLLAPSLLAFLSVVSADDVPSDVINLTTSTFLPIVEKEPLILVEFFAPWCGHCKALAPQYEEAASILKGRNIKIAKVDCVDEADLCQANGIQGYPTLRVYRYGQATDYQGPRKADGIVAYMTKQALPAVSEVTATNLEEIKAADNVVVVAYVSSTTDAPAPAFSAAAEKHRDDYLFGLSTDKDAIAAAKVTPPAVVVYRRFDEPSVTYPFPIQDMTAADLEDWVKELAIPTLAEVTSENYAVYAQSTKPLAYIFLDPTTEQKETTVAAIRPVASKYKSKVNFVWIDAIKFGDHAKALNLAEVKWPSFVIQDLGKQLKYPFDQSKEVEAAGVEEFVSSYLDGKLEPSLKSQPVPAEQLENVYDLVGKEFERIVFDDSKDVFVEFYASWCGHCKRLKPTWDSLADHFAPVNDSLTIAKFEAQENDLPPSVGFSIAGFPTLKFKKAGTRDFIEYEGDRSLESLIAFIEENAANSLKLPSSQPHVADDSGDLAQGVLDDHDEL
ncbi:Protein disulfide isomerase [Mycena indigotica]|uniref:Protein disulfide-isomerase n=1 Tax=Mycena indigotica TaxID=2126181 RepID=A0A8H6SLA3_9AGAR|nr:Protein disulfide isomerase [Mycena indigotica]KAF7301708.1 Protein disulfide isomerase [Mycena indigotica]